MTDERPRLPGGFHVLRPLELLNWRPISIGPDIPMAEQPMCPACRIQLDPLALLEGRKASIRVGTCRACGYTGYRDRPRADWISRYYAKVWSHGAEKDVEELRGKRPPENPATATLRQALAILPDHNRAVLEIGAGYGTMLRFVRDAGFGNVVGIESSGLRAEVARAATGLTILSGDFESSGIQEALGRIAPFGLIYLFHVLEHTYHPAETIRAISRLQSPGDLLAIGVPNFAGEPAMSILLFLPHLHSFSLTSLSTLLGRAGYEIIDRAGCDGTNLNIIARKTGRPEALPPTPAAPFDVHAKFAGELALASLTPSGEQPLNATRGQWRYFWSKKDGRVSGIEPYRWHWRIADTLRDRRNLRSLLVEPLDELQSETPFVLSFAGGPFLCVK